MLTTKTLNTIDNLVKSLSTETDKWMSLAIAIDLADEVLKVLLPENSEWQKQLNRDSRNSGVLPQPLPLDTFKNQKQVTWFNIHPESASARSAFKLFYADDCALESNFFWFSESATKQKIAEKALIKPKSKAIHHKTHKNHSPIQYFHPIPIKHYQPNQLKQSKIH